MTTTKIYELPNGRTMSTTVGLPFIVRKYGIVRRFGSLKAARAAAEAGSSIFFDTSPGCGTLVERVGW